MPTSTPRQRRVPPEQALPVPEIGASQAIGAGAAGVAVGTGAGAAAGVKATAPAVAVLKGGQESVEAVLEALRAFFVLNRARQERWIAGEARARLPQQDLLDLIADENAREAEFERKVRDRVRVGATKALALDTEAERRTALAKVLAREKLYARQRSEAMAVRALSTLDRVVLQAESPEGAFWEFVEDDRTTPDCRMMGGKFWPWRVLLVFHPPTHGGCRCKLHAKAVAVRRGWMHPTRDVQDLDVALRRAAAARAMLHEGWEEMREAALSAGVADAARFDAALLKVGGLSV